MKKKRKIFESLRFNVFSFVYNVFLKFATPLESGEPELSIPFFCILKAPIFVGAYSIYIFLLIYNFHI